MEKLPPLTTTQLRVRVAAAYSLLEEQYQKRPKETVQGAAAVLYVELLRLVQPLAQHDPPLQLAFERLLDDSILLGARPDPVAVVKPGTLRVVDLLHLFRYAKIVLDEQRNRQPDVGDASTADLSSTESTDGTSAAPFLEGFDPDSGLEDRDSHPYRSTRRGGARSCAPVHTHYFSGT
jgi:hypothetical protein